MANYFGLRWSRLRGVLDESLGEAHHVDGLDPHDCTSNHKDLARSHQDLVGASPLVNPEAVVDLPGLLLLLDLGKLCWHVDGLGTVDEIALARAGAWATLLTTFC